MQSTAVPHQPVPATDADLAGAVLRTLAYVDGFDYPLTAAEIQRYLVQHSADLATVTAVLSTLSGTTIATRDGYYFLPGRDHIVSLRQQRATLARQLWPDAVRYGRVIGQLPFVRMVAVTGSLAVDNPRTNADIDYLIVTAHGRLWLCRALVIGVVRLAARRGLDLCPNYFISDAALTFPEHNLYTAHEVVQMVPLAGRDVYRRLRAANTWVARFLPNAGDPSRDMTRPVETMHWSGRAAERLLSTPPGAALDRWEMQRKIRKFTTQSGSANGQFGETAFTPNLCKGHFDNHGRRALGAYAERARGQSKS